MKDEHDLLQDSVIYVHPSVAARALVYVRVADDKKHTLGPS